MSTVDSLCSYLPLPPRQTIKQFPSRAFNMTRAAFQCPCSPNISMPPLVLNTLTWLRTRWRHLCTVWLRFGLLFTQRYLNTWAIFKNSRRGSINSIGAPFCNIKIYLNSSTWLKRQRGTVKLYKKIILYWDILADSFVCMSAKADSFLTMLL